jgi:hypothetical protein
MKETNNYEIAIKEDRTIDFLLGREEYHYADDQFSSVLHTSRYTFDDIKDYGEKYGEAEMLKQFKEDIKKVLELDLATFEFLNISTYIYIYMLDYKERSLSIEWIPDEETKTLIKKHYNDFVNRYIPTIDFNNQFPKQNNGFFLRNIIAKYSQIKERFGVDLLA